jgi:hypothetical protein
VADDIPQDGEAREPDGEAQWREIEERAQQLLADEAFAYAVELVARRMVAEHIGQQHAHKLELCVDAEIEKELDREWDRSNPPNPFGVLQEVTKEKPGAWVSPGMSIRMFATVEYVARHAYNEATRA